MHKIEYRRRTIGITPYKWGFYLHLRWKLHWFHSRVGLWVQDGVRVSTRHQMKIGRPRRYVTGIRLHVSLWHTHGPKQGKPVTFGLMFYGGRGSA